MHYNLLRISVLVACLMMLSCASSPTPVTAPTPPLPAALTVQCPPLPELPDNRCDSCAMDLKLVYDTYGLCAGRLVELIEWVQTHRQQRSY